MRATRNLCRGITLLEAIIVIVIIGIIASLIMPHFFVFKARSIAKLAEVALKLIQAAAWIYRIEYDTYAQLDNTAVVNRDLKLDLPTTNSELNFSIIFANRTAFTATAVSTSNPPFSEVPQKKDVWWINETNENVTKY